MKSQNTTQQRTAIRTGALLRVGHYLRAGRGFSPIIRLRTDRSGSGLVARLKSGVDRAIAMDEAVVVRASRASLIEMRGKLRPSGRRG